MLLLNMAAPFRLYSMISGIQFLISLKVVAVLLWLSLKLDVILVASGFELIFCYSIVSVLFFESFLLDSCFVYHSLLEAMALARAGFFLSLQLQLFPCFSFIFVDSKTVLLWLEIICFLFCMQL